MNNLDIYQIKKECSEIKVELSRQLALKEILDEQLLEIENKIEKRDYQEECIKLINETVNENLIICLPTGTGKNYIIVHSLQPKIKYLILVPRIFLLEQISNEIIKYYPEYKIQLIGHCQLAQFSSVCRFLVHRLERLGCGVLVQQVLILPYHHHSCNT
jgi:superfamily II DNA or RNA helicase